MALRSVILLVFLLTPALTFGADKLPEQYAHDRVQAAINHWRDRTSRVEAAMKIHRPDWEREMSLTSWTSGTDRSLVRFTAPARDAGSASLTVGNEMWS